MDSQAKAVALLSTIGLIGVVIGLAVAVVICLVLFNCAKRVPAQFRKQEPGMIWLLLIPCFNLVWNFFVFPKLSQGLKAYFDSVGRTDVGDCGAGIGLGYSICVACCIIPFANWIAGPAALVLLIIYLVKVSGLKNQLPAA